MTQEEKQLLIKDLCGRLPYGVKCNVWYGPKSPAFNEKDKYTDDILETINPKKGNCTFHNAIGYDFGFFPVEHLKPYLRPMSSMTEEEKMEVRKLGVCDDGAFHNDIYDIGISMEEAFTAISWFLERHFDINYLIEKGLALEAPEGMYSIKEK